MLTGSPVPAAVAPYRGGRIAVYRHLLAAQVRSQTAYRTSFLIDLATQAMAPAIDLLAVLAVFRVTRTIGGFDAVEVLIMFGLSATAFALADLAVGNIEKIRDYVRRGLLDAVLVRPLSVLGQLLAVDFTLRRFVKIAVGILVLGLSCAHAGIAWTPTRVGMVVIAPMAGAVFFGAVFVASATVSFFWIDSSEFANGFTYGGRDFTSYPITVYSGLFRRLFAFSFGFAFVAYYPALILLGRPDPLGLPAWVSWSSPAVSVVAAGAAALVWRFGVRHYRSTGS
jgi:ABC-2 type transport system permease protein